MYRYHSAADEFYAVVVIITCMILALIAVPYSGSTYIFGMDGRRRPTIPDPIYWPQFFAVVIPIAAALGTALISMWLKWQNERITVGEKEVTWVDSHRRIRVTSPVSEVASEGAKIVQGYVGAWYEVRTGHGVIRWTTNIDNCDDLVRFFNSLRSSPESAGPATATSAPEATESTESKAGAYGYRGIRNCGAGVFHLIWGSFFLCAGLYDTASILLGGHPRVVFGDAGSGGTPVDRPLAVMPFFVGPGLAAVLYGIRLIGLHFKGSIELDGQAAVERNWRGTVKRYDLDKITPNHLIRRSKTFSEMNTLGWNYSVATPDGTLKWSERLNGAQELFMRIKAMAEVNEARIFDLAQSES